MTRFSSEESVAISRLTVILFDLRMFGDLGEFETMLGVAPVQAAKMISPRGESMEMTQDVALLISNGLAALDGYPHSLSKSEISHRLCDADFDRLKRLRSLGATLFPHLGGEPRSLQP